MKNNNFKTKVILAFLIIILIFAFLFLIYWRPNRSNAGVLDSFALCLRDLGVTMYGAEWCPHCQNEKNAFGDSFRLVPYVECPENPKECLAKNVDRYPTWIFPASPAGGPGEKKSVGEQGLQKLSEESGCSLPQGLSQ